MVSINDDAVLKRCSRCGGAKPLAAFHRRGNGRQAWCKACVREWDAAYHQRMRSIRYVQRKLRHRKTLDWLTEYKRSRACTDCGGFFHPAAMTFDHLPGSVKRGDVSDLLCHGMLRSGLAEIAKCELVCANCHAVRTFVRRERPPDAGTELTLT